ncbi:hypothetical protein [Desulfosporosinus sp. SB140]|uniref:hypothetical protein n=1 Tax=Desulfosporosinus paludis TaxID=3115649 RepID=UPI00389048B6
MCDPALSRTTQSKLAVQATAMWSGVPAISAVHGAMAAVNILVHRPDLGSVALTEFAGLLT